MTQMVPFLATTGNTAPFIGLFGTVWGIMNSFVGIGKMGSANLAVVAPGISEALVATAAGLAAAIPAVIAFNYFMSKIRVVESELQSFSADFLNIVERDILRTERRRA
jgi:biopolymer transport protein TolQ